MIATRCVDYHVTQVVDGTKGIHGMIPKVHFAVGETILNLKTAKALGLTIPETLLATADEVIQ